MQINPTATNDLNGPRRNVIAERPGQAPDRTAQLLATDAVVHLHTFAPAASSLDNRATAVAAARKLLENGLLDSEQAIAAAARNMVIHGI